MNLTALKNSIFTVFFQVNMIINANAGTIIFSFSSPIFLFLCQHQQQEHLIHFFNKSLSNSLSYQSLIRLIGPVTNENAVIIVRP